MSSALSSTKSDPTPPSIHSVPSNSSLASGTSLSRRPRIRTRSKTVTGGASLLTRSEEIPPPVPSPVTSHSTDNTTQEQQRQQQQQQQRHGPALSSQPLGLLHPPSGSLRSGSSDHTSQGDSAVGEVTLVAPVAQPSPVSGKIPKAAKLASHLASIETSLNPLPSAFERDPNFTSNARDSISTTQSGTSSSFYPPSTSTYSGPDSPSSPRTVTEDIPHPIINSPVVAEDTGAMQQQYDGDDVAYRLRLLVNNNYFLPPAHMKPSPEDFATALNTKKPSKPQSSTFLDIFRIGKSKSKPTTPTSPAFDIPPMLRTTSDSIAVSRALRSHTVPALHVSGQPPPHHLDKGRVVVVRERMDDITVAAKQSEQEMKNRSVRPASSPNRHKRDVDDVIDPTDAVDIPLPGANYPFAVQASALHGLGVHESVGAAVLAERLPPDNSNVSSSGPDDHWRKALLHEAVYHSLDTTPDVSTFSHPAGTSPILGSPVNGASPPRESTPTSRAKRLQQRIISTQPSTDLEDSLESNEPRRKSTSSRVSTPKTDNNNKLLTTPDSTDSRRSSVLPMRMTTPVGAWTPLSPAPRRQAINAIYSISQTDLQDAAAYDVDQSVSPKCRLRRSMSTPMLTEALDELRGFVMTPPPPPIPSTRRSSQMTSHTLSYEASHERPSFNSTFSSRANSHYDLHEIHDRPPRNSAVPSIMAARPSISSYSQASLSPSTSAFQDALNRGTQSDISSLHHSSEIHLSQEDLTARSSVASPPPRMSSSFVHIALHPPPRSSSFNYSTELIQHSRSNASEPRIRVSAPSPAASPSRHDSLSLTVDIPSTMDHVAIQSPAPSSPTSFFDTIQSQPNAMDDLDSSSDDSDEADDAREPPSQPPPFGSDIRTRANSAVSPRPAKLSIMKLGNFSTPYINRTGVVERSRALPGSTVDSRKALGYTPSKATFFAERKNDLGHGSELTGFDIVRLARGQGQPPASTAAAAQPVAGPSNFVEDDTVRPATMSQLQVGPTPRKRESVMRLDGMLLQHMEAEKDRIRKIASSLKATSSNTSLIS